MGACKYAGGKPQGIHIVIKQNLFGVNCSDWHSSYFKLTFLVSVNLKGVPCNLIVT